MTANTDYGAIGDEIWVAAVVKFVALRGRRGAHMNNFGDSALLVFNIYIYIEREREHTYIHTYIHIRMCVRTCGERERGERSQRNGIKKQNKDRKAGEGGRESRPLEWSERPSS